MNLAKKKGSVRLWGAIRFGLLLSLVLLLWWYFRTYELFLILVILILLPFASFLAMRRCMDGFTAQVLLPGGGIGKDRAIAMTVQVKSLCRFLGFAMDVCFAVRNVFTDYAQEKKERIWAGPGISIVEQKELVSHHVGRVEVEVSKLVLYDWLGIWAITQEKKTSAWVIVGPEILAAEDDIQMAVEDFPDENETKKHGTDVNPDIEIREYIPGDDLKMIHWKLTAKTGRTMVRERLASGRDKINVLLATTKDPTENDALMASLHGLGLLLLDKGYPIRLCWLGYGGTLTGRYLAEEGEFVNALDEILSVSGIKDPDKARGAMETEFPGESYIVVKHGTYKGRYIR
ncbi:MAG: DUF58 domain-containing protein [Lachnospiraceae bacterium]|nr:DUF58 domain-containing protein [Lachnospiraceae bacterium]